MTPLPAMGLLQLEPTGQLADAVKLPRGTEILVTADDGSTGVFRSMRELRIHPFRLADVNTMLRPRGGLRVVLTFRAPFARSDDLGTVPLHVTHLDDFAASLTVLTRLRKHLDGAKVVYDEDVNEDTTGTTCEVSFGTPKDEETVPELSHPIQGVRSFFHFPRTELFLNVKFPRASKSWTQVHLILDLDARWPKSLRLNRDMFQTFTVPIWNVKRSMAAPILCEGNLSRHPVRFPDPATRFQLHSVVGVYEIGEKGSIPLRPAIVSGGSGSYEVEQSRDEQGQRTSYLKLQFPTAFTAPTSISTDAYWYQPAFSEAMSGKLSVELYGRSIPGVGCTLRGELRAHAVNPIQDDFDGMLQVLALKSKSLGYTLEDVTTLLGALGALADGPFRMLVPSLVELSVNIIPQARDSGGGYHHVYRFRVSETDVTARPLLEAALAQLAKLLQTWTSDADVSVQAHVASTDEALDLPV
jgi:type VI secretion system protein ImpG